MLRLVRFVKRAPNISRDAFDAFRRDQLGPFVAGGQTRLNLLRYVQTHGDSASTEAEGDFLARREGVDNRFDGVEEYWWKNETACLDVLSETDGIWCEIERFCREWVDANASLAWLAVDYPQVSTAAARIVAAPKSGLFRLVFAITPSPSLDVVKAQRYWLIRHGPVVRSFAAARGTLAYNQVHRFSTEYDARLHRPGLLSESPHMGHAEAWFAQAAPLPGSDCRSAIQAALADEKAFIDWSQSSVFIGKELVFVDRDWM